MNADTVSGKNAVAFNSEGWDYLNRGENYNAIFSFKNALQKNPRYKDSLLGLGKAYYNIDEFEDWLSELNSVEEVE
jgi:tetratricopeptide (TPR) repeat protein